MGLGIGGLGAGGVGVGGLGMGVGWWNSRHRGLLRAMVLHAALTVFRANYHTELLRFSAPPRS